MPKFMFLYKGEATDMSAMTPEQGKAVMEKWGIWMGRVGSALSDVGAPLGAAVSILDNGKDGSPTSLSGYSIVDASDMKAARALADGHPYLSDNDGKFALDIHELLPNPM